MAVDQWRSYLQHAEFHIVTDHKSLVQLTEQRLHTTWQLKVLTRLIGLQYKIVYRKGADNGAADALSLMLHMLTVQLFQFVSPNGFMTFVNLTLLMLEFRNCFTS
jgi:hypothetical protein